MPRVEPGVYQPIFLIDESHPCRCRLCGKILLFSVGPVDRHMRVKHGSSWAAYRQAHLPQLPDAGAEEAADLAVASTNSHGEEAEAAEDDVMVVLREIYNGSGPGGEDQRKDEGLKVEEDPTQAHSLSDSSGKKLLGGAGGAGPVCQICGRHVSDVRQHIESEHTAWINDGDSNSESDKLMHR
jgi:hypothetical protein